MEVQCAWCRKGLGTKPGGDGITHGMCQECADRMLADFRVDRVKGFRQRAGPLDYPQHELDPEVWDTSTQPPALKHDVVQVILQAVDELGHYGIRDSDVNDIFIAGSITGVQWEDDSDIDVQLVVQTAPETLEALKHGIGTLNSHWHIGEHPVHFFVLSPEDLQGGRLRHYDAVYDVLDSHWVKAPAPAQNDPEQLEQHVYERAEDFARQIDLGVGKTHRDARDLAYFRKVLHRAGPDLQERVRARLQSKVTALDADVEQLITGLNDLHQERARAFQEALERGDSSSPNLLPGNLVWKLLERWRYIQMLRSLAELAEGGITEKEELQLAARA